jgi:hypothetical protein
MNSPALLTALFASVLQLASAIASPAASTTIYITRHGEKIWTLGCLNATGETLNLTLPPTSPPPPPPLSILIYMWCAGHARAENFIAVFNR